MRRIRLDQRVHLPFQRQARSGLSGGGPVIAEPPPGGNYLTINGGNVLTVNGGNGVTVNA